MQLAAAIKQVAVSVIASGVDPQEEKLEGLTERLSLGGLPDFACRVRSPVLGLQTKKSCPVPGPVTAENVIVRGFTIHVAWGVVAIVNPIDAYDATMTEPIARPNAIWGRKRANT